MLEEMVVAQKVMFDAIRNAAMDVKEIPITPQMMADVRSASAAYNRHPLLQNRNSDRRGSEIEGRSKVQSPH